MKAFIAKEKIFLLCVCSLPLLIYMFLSTATITAQAADFPAIPEDATTYTKKTANYIPEYEYCLYGVYSSLPSLGSEPAFITVNGFTGTQDEAREFSKYIYQYYDYTGRLTISCSEIEQGSQLYYLHIQFDNPQEIYSQQMAVERELLSFSQSINTLSDRDKVKQANARVATNAKYDTSLQKTSCYSNIIEGTSTCNGYTRAFYAICSYSGIPCENIRGYVDDKLHIWNRVKVGQTWEYVDVTWNSMSHSDTWLLVTKDKMDQDHVSTS